MVAIDFPDTPTVGQVFDKWTWNGTIWVLTDRAPRGLIGQTQVVTGQTFGTVRTDITGTDVTFTGVAGRWYRATVHCPEITQVSGTGLIQLFVCRQGASRIIMNRCVANCGAGNFINLTAVAVYQITGADTVAGQISTSTGTCNTVGSANERIITTVEDLGA